MAKSSSRRSLKSLFSRSEVNLSESPEKEKEKNEEEKTKFKFLKFKKKTKSDPAPGKTANEIQQLLSAAEPSNTAKDGEAWGDGITADNKSSIYGTTSRSKGKEFSYSELDLRKPKRFATFSFAFKKKKKNDDQVNISQSTFGLHSTGIEEQEETSPNHSQMDLDQPNTKMIFSMSQPELDAIDTFEIPSPPVVATNPSESYVTLPNESRSTGQPEAMERLTNGSNLFDVHAEQRKAPIAAIPELQLDNSDSSEEKRDDDSDPSASATRAETSLAVDNQTEPRLPAGRPPTALDTSDHAAAVVNSVATSDGPCDNDVLLQSRTNTEISHTGSTRVAPDIADVTSLNGELSPASADSKIDGAIAQSTAVPRTDDSFLDSYSASVRQEVSISRTERSAPVTAMSVAKASAVGGEKGVSPVRQDAVYGALYESLFPRSFSSEVMSSPTNPPPRIITEIRHLDSESEPVMVGTLNERRTETNVQLDSTARRVDDAVGGYTKLNATFSERKVIYSSESSRLSSYRTYAASGSGSEPGNGDKVPYSEPTRSLSEVKPDSLSLIQDNVGSVPTVQSSAPPVSDYVTSQGGDTRVTRSKRRAILVKELVTDEASADPVCPSPVPKNMSAAKRIEVRIETRETYFAPSQTDGSVGLLSPAYLSVGSDDCSVSEIYYSAEEDNEEEEGSENEEMYTVDERVESYVVDEVREAGPREEFPQQAEVVAERGIRKREDGEFRVVIIKMQNEEVLMADEEEKEDVSSRFEVEEKVKSKMQNEEVLMANEEEKEDVSSRFEVEEKVKSKMQNEEVLMADEEEKEDVSSRFEVEEKVKSKMQNEEVLMANEEEKEDVSSRFEVEEKVKSKMQNEEVLMANEEEKEDVSSRFEVEEKVKSKMQNEEVLMADEEEKEDVSSRFEVEEKVKNAKVISKMQNEEVLMADEEEKEDVSSRFEVEEKVGGQRSDTEMQEIETFEFLVGRDAENLEKEVATAVLPQVRDEGAEELPATPVQQVDKPAVCDLAPPSSEPHGEGSEGNVTEELETEDHPNGEAQLPGLETQYPAHKDLMSSVMHTASSSTVEGDKLTPGLSEAEKQVSLSAEAAHTGNVSEDATETNRDTAGSAVTAPSAGGEAVPDTTARSAELQSEATEVEHNRAASSEWVDPITQSADRTTTAREQVAVSADTHRAEPEAAETRSERQPSEVQPDPIQGSLTSSRTQPTAASEGFPSVTQSPKAEKGSVDDMNLGYSTLSTKLSTKTPSPPKEDESKYRFHKVSLINEANATEVSRDTVDFSPDSAAVAESSRTDSDSEYRWRNRFVGVSQYRPHNIDPESSSISDSLSYRMSDSRSSPPSSSSSSSSSSALPDSTAYKRLDNASYPEEHVTIGNRLSDMSKVSLSCESEPVGAPRDEWRRSLLEQEEPAAPAGREEGEGEAERFKSGWDSQQLPVSGISSAYGHDAIDRFEDNDASLFTGVFKATLVELVSEPAALPSTPPASPDAESPIQFDMDTLVDTLKSMGPSLRPRSMSLRGVPPMLMSSLPPIVEDAPSPVTPDIPASLISQAKKMEADKGVYILPGDLGLKRSSPRDTRSPLELMKQNQQQQQQQQQPGTKGLNLPLRASLTDSIIMRRASDSSPEELKSPVLNGNGCLPPPSPSSRLDNSIIFGSHRSASTDQTVENGTAHRSLFRTSSLPDKGPSNDRMSSGRKELGEPRSEAEPPVGSRFDRFSFLLNTTSSSLSSSSLTGTESPNARMSLPPLRGIGSPPSNNSPTHLLSPVGSVDLQRPFTTTDSPLNMVGQTQGMGMGTGLGTGLGTGMGTGMGTGLGTGMGMGMGMGTGMGTGMGMGMGMGLPSAPVPAPMPILQRSFSNEGPVGVQQTSLFNSRHGGSQFQSQELELESNLASKYRAFPDAYLTKEKEHGKLNPRPGKMYIFDQPGMCGQRIDVRSDVIDATSWELQETISIRVVRGGWVLYEKPHFKGEKIALDEGDIELTYPFSPEEQLQNGERENGERENGEQNGETSDVPSQPARRFIIGSLRRAVRDYSVPEISLFPEENAEGKKVIFRDTSEDARIFGFPIKANSIIVNAGLWLVYAHPFFQGLPRVLEVGGFSNPAAWGVEQPYVGSLHPLKVGEPRVENISEPKMVIFDKPYFTGKSRTITTNTRDFMTRADRQQTAFMYSVGSLKVQGGMWVGYEKEGFRGQQYLLEEGEYQDWRVWGGRDAELRSVRVIRADLTDPLMVMFEQPEDEQDGLEEDNTFEVTEAIPDVELFEYKTSTRSINVLSGAWIAYSHVDYSGNQYILEKGFYNNCADWGSQDNRICSVQPILLAPSDSSRTRAEVILYSEPDFQGECHVFKCNQEELSEKLLTKSCRVSGGSWVLYENKQHSGNLYVLSEGDYPNLNSMGCPPGCNIRSFKVVPMTLTVPSISLFGLECLEGREITMDTEIPSMVEEGFNNHILSVRVNSGWWVICEHSNYRGRQFLIEPIEITNWPKYSSIQTIGSMFPVRQKRRFLRIKNKERGHFLSVQGGVEEMKSGRVVVTPDVEPMSDIWFYQDGFIKSKLSPTMSLQVMGNIEPAAKLVLWTETRQPIQTWTAQMRGLISSLLFPGFVLDVKGGKTYDKDHVVIMPESEERPSQQWEIELL